MTNSILILAIFFDGEYLEDVAFFDIVVFFETDTALVALRYLLDAVLEALERTDVVVGDDDTVAYDTDARTALDLTALDIAAGDVAGTFDADDVAHLGSTEDNFSGLGSEHTLHRALDLFDTVVDDAVHAHIHAVALSVRLGGRVGTDVEADDDGVRRIREHDVTLVDSADSAVDDVDTHLFVRELFKTLAHSFHGTLYVGFDDDLQLLDLAELHLIEEVVEGDLGLSVELCAVRPARVPDARR